MPEYGQLVRMLAKYASLDSHAGIDPAIAAADLTALGSILRNPDFRNRQDTAFRAALYNAIFHDEPFSLETISARASTIANCLGVLRLYLEDGDHFTSNPAEAMTKQSVADSLVTLWDFARDYSAQISFALTAKHTALDEANSQVALLRDEIEQELSAQRKQNHDQQRKMQVDYVAVLGVFSAIAMAANAGVDFFGSIANALTLAGSLLDTILILTATGVILFDCMTLLLTFVWAMSKDEKLPRYITVIAVVANALPILAICIACSIGAIA